MSVHRGVIGRFEEACEAEPVWFFEDGKETLVDAEEVAERECSACLWLWTLYDTWLQQAEGQELEVTPSDLEFAFEAISLEQYCEWFKVPPESISSREWQLIKTLKVEQGRAQAQRQWEQMQKQEANRG